MTGDGGDYRPAAEILLFLGVLALLVGLVVIALGVSLVLALRWALAVAV